VKNLFRNDFLFYTKVNLSFSEHVIVKGFKT